MLCNFCSCEYVRKGEDKKNGWKEKWILQAAISVPSDDDDVQVWAYTDVIDECDAI